MLNKLKTIINADEFYHTPAGYFFPTKELYRASTKTNVPQLNFYTASERIYKCNHFFIITVC